MNLDSYSNCDRFDSALSILRATSELSMMLVARNISPNAPYPSFFFIT